MDQAAPIVASNDETLISPVSTPSVSLFAELGLDPRLLSAVTSAGYTDPTAVQAAAIPAALAGHDLMVSSATGSGKTAAFVLPTLQRLMQNGERNAPGRGPRALFLSPTRELSLQITRACETYGRTFKGLRVASVVGGVPYGAQLRAVRGALDVLIATPGRLLDLLQGGQVHLARVEVLVLDEADRMLDMGFIEDIEAIAAATPRARQTLLFSATLDGKIAQLASGLMREPRRVEVESPIESRSNITERLHWADGRAHKDKILDRLLADPSIDQAVVFTSTQHDAERLAESLQADGHAVSALHGGMPQGQRTRTLTALRQRRLRVLVATDVAARGIDVPTITHVINYGLPINVEDYVHRIGRTGRAGRTGLAVTLAESGDSQKIRRIERYTATRIPVETLEGLEPRRPDPSRSPAPPSRRGGKRPAPAGAKPGARFERPQSARHDGAAPVRKRSFAR